MEKANGISLDTLIRYWEQENWKSFAQRMITKHPEKTEHYTNLLQDVEKEIAKIKTKSPDFKDFELKDDEIKKMLNQYIEVLTEQFNKVDKGGKTLHADIHPGNVFVDVNAVKSGKGKAFTLIDTGNTIDLSKQQALSSMKLTSYVQNGNAKDITGYILDGAVLPSGMTKEKALELVEKDLKTIFFDNATNLDTMNNDAILKLTNNIMRKHNIIPNDTQLNLNKAKKSANNSFEGIVDGFFTKRFDKMKDSGVGAVAGGTQLLKDAALIFGKMKKDAKMQEIKNLLQLPPSEILRQLKNPNQLKTNSEEYLTYKFKQSMPNPEKAGIFD